MSIKIVDEEWSWKTISLKQFVEEKNYNMDWCDFFEKPDIKDEIKKISDFLENDTKLNLTIYPEIYNVFRAFSVSLNKLKLLVLGQDPFHNGSAVGLCFSVKKGNDINPSLLNIYKELENCGYTINKNGDLSHLVKQGVFLLNTALTVNKGDPESHLHIWYDFSEKLLQYISEKKSDIAWLLMGKKAADFQKYSKKCFITSHPSPLSAYRGFGKYSAFIGSKIFLEINKYLTSIGKDEIKW